MYELADGRVSGVNARDNLRDDGQPSSYAYGVEALLQYQLSEHKIDVAAGQHHTARALETSSRSPCVNHNVSSRKMSCDNSIHIAYGSTKSPPVRTYRHAPAVLGR